MVRTSSIYTRDDIILQREKVINILEYAPNMMLVCSKNRQSGQVRLLLFEGWRNTRIYESAQSYLLNNSIIEERGQNKAKGNISTLACTLKFDHQTNPFVFWAHESSLFILNTQTEYIENFGDTNTSCHDNQPAFFFKDEFYGSSLNFSSFRNMPNKKKRLKWVQMILPKDVSEILQKLQRLPAHNRDKLF